MKLVRQQWQPCRICFVYHGQYGTIFVDGDELIALPLIARDAVRLTVMSIVPEQSITSNEIE